METDCKSKTIPKTITINEAQKITESNSFNSEQFPKKPRYSQHLKFMNSFLGWYQISRV